MTSHPNGTPPKSPDASGKKAWRYQTALWLSVPCSVVFWSLVGSDLMLGSFVEAFAFFLPAATIAALIVGVRKRQGKPRWSYSTAILVSIVAMMVIDILATKGAGDGSGLMTRLVMLGFLLPGGLVAAALVAVRNRRASQQVEV